MKAKGLPPMKEENISYLAEKNLRLECSKAGSLAFKYLVTFTSRKLLHSYLIHDFSQSSRRGHILSPGSFLTKG
jgi:hypothetical protein